MKKINKKIIQASEGRIQSFMCPKCHNNTLYDTESDVYKLMDIGYDDLFVCDECGASYYGRVGYDMKPRFTPADEEDVDAAIKCSVSRSDLRALTKAAIEVQTREELDKVISSLLSHDKQLYLKYSEMARDGEYSPAAIGKMISDDLYNSIEAATNTCNIGVMPILDSDEDEKINAAISPKRKSETIKRIHDAVQNRAVKWFKEDYGDPDISLNDINSMLVVDETQADDGRTIVEVRAELSYDGMWELSEALNKVITKYDKEAYFDMEEPGIMTAYLDLDGIYSSKVISVKRTPVNASISPSVRTEVMEFLNDSGHYVDYNQNVEDVAEMFELSKDDAEGLVSDWALNADHEQDIDELPHMQIEVFSGGNSDGFSITITEDGTVVFEEEYRYGRDASWNKKSATDKAPYVADIINRLCSDYDVDRTNIKVVPGRNVFKQTPVDDKTVEEFKQEYIESSTVLSTVGFNDWLYQKYGWFSDDMTDDDYDRYWSEYEQAQEAENELNSTITAASYGGAFDIEDDQYFTRDDLNEFGYSVAELISLDLMGDVECSGSWIDNNQLTIQFVYDDDYECEVNIKIDMRKIRRPSDLLAKYGDAVAQKAVSEFKSQGVLDIESDESVESAIDIGRPSSWYDPDDEDPMEFGDVSQEFDVDFDGTIMQVDERGFVTLDKNTLDWAEGCEIDLEYGTYDVDPDQIIDDVWDLITDYLPDEDGPARYVINGSATLCYNLSNILSWSGEDFYGDYEIDTDNIEIEFDRKHSKAYSVEVKRI